MTTRVRFNGWILGIGLALGLIGGFALGNRRSSPPPPWERGGFSQDEKDHVRNLAESALSSDLALIHDLEDKGKLLRTKLESVGTSDDDLRSAFGAINKIRWQLAQHRFELDLKVRQYVGPQRIHFFDPLGPPPPGPPPDAPRGPRDER